VDQTVLFRSVHTLDMADEICYTVHVRGGLRRGALEYGMRVLALAARLPALRTLVLPLDRTWDAVYELVCLRISSGVRVLRRDAADSLVERESEYSALQHYPIST
jgi:hypothetical protein